MFSFEAPGSFQKTESFLKAMLKLNSHILNVMNSCGQKGVDALAQATPVESGLARSSWRYEIDISGGNYTLTWLNSDVEDGFPVVLMLQYGYGTGTGGYVPGRDFINPAIKPIFDKIAQDVWKAVTSA